MLLQKQASGSNLHQPPIPSARSPNKNPQKWGLRAHESKAALGFTSIKEQMDAALLDEIDLLKKANVAIGEKYKSLNSDLSGENENLRNQITQLTQANQEA